MIGAIDLNHRRCAGAKKSAMKRPSSGTCRRMTTPKRRPRMRAQCSSSEAVGEPRIVDLLRVVIQRGVE